MLKAELYTKYNNMQRCDVKKLLQTSLHLIKWKEDGNDMILDLGCGSGDVTRGPLLKSMSSFKRIVGVDISREMLAYAKEYNAHPDVDYVQLDLGCEQVPNQLVAQFDHAFSFNMFHWVPNQRQLFRNVFDMLKPGGNVLATMILDTNVMLIYTKMDTPKWRQFVPNFADVIFPYQHSPNPVMELEDVIRTAGFAHIIKTEQIAYKFENAHEFKLAMESVMPFLKFIPVECHNEFMDDFMQSALDMNVIQNQQGSDCQPVVHYTKAMLYFRKPDH